MINKLILFIFIISFFSCCSIDNSKSKELIEANLVEVLTSNNEGLLSDFVKDVEFLVLDGKGKWFLPGGVVKMKFYEKFTVILDSRNKNICVFNKDGQVQFVLKNPGKGPGEFFSPSDAGMDYLRNKVFVFESSRRKVHWYDLNGIWIETINLPTRLNNIHTLPDGNFLYQNDQLSNDDFDSCRLMIADESGNVQQCIWDCGPNNRNTAGFQDACWIMPNKNGSHYYRDLYLGDTIYYLDSDFELNPSIVMNAGKYRLPKDIALDFGKRDLFKNYLRTHAYYPIPGGFIISGNMKDQIFFHVNSNSHEVKSYTDIKDDLTGFGGFPGELSEDGKYLVRTVRAQYYMENVDAMFKFQDVLFPDIQQKIKSIVQEGNDQIDIILLYYKLKD